ncbi:MAG: ABC transporter permease [Desulfurivibrionaceae bacterium]|nr:ABC transporter permease [Desulfurivibrionaceae bacterium]
MNRTDAPAKQAPRARGGSLMRLRGLVRKEFLQIRRDPSSIAIAFLMPVVLLLLFGYGVSLDAQHVPIALVVEDQGGDTAAFTGAFQHNTYFNPKDFPTMQGAKEAMRYHQVDGMVWLRANFAPQLHSGSTAPIEVILNGVDANSARLVSGYVEGVWRNWLVDRARSQGRILNQPVVVEQRIWFNSEVRSRNFLVPGLIAVIMTLIGALLTAMVMAREWERGTMEALMVTPVAIGEVLVGKLIPYFVMGMGGLALSVAMALFLFHVPLRGSFWVLTAASALFLLVALGMGLLISIVARSQFVAGQAAMVSTFLPAFLLSGFLFDINSMPVVVQGITYLIGARYYVAILQTLFLAGDVFAVIWPNALALMIMASFFLGLSRLRSRKRLD